MRYLLNASEIDMEIHYSFLQVLYFVRTGDVTREICRFEGMHVKSKLYRYEHSVLMVSSAVMGMSVFVPHRRTESTPTVPKSLRYVIPLLPLHENQTLESLGLRLGICPIAV